MIGRLLKNDNITACFITAIIGLIGYILIMIVAYGRDITQLQTQMNSANSFTSQQLNRIESNQIALINNFDGFKELVLRNLKITNG